MAAASPALTLKPQNSVSSCTSLVPMSCCLSAGAWGESLWESESIHEPFKGHLFPAGFSLTWMDKVPVDFYSQILLGLLFLALVLQPGEPGWGCDALLQRGYFGDIHPVLNHHTWVWGQSVLHLCPSYQFPCGFLTALVIGHLFSFSLDGSPGWFFCNLVVILMCSWEEVSSVYLLCLLDKNSWFGKLYRWILLEF